MSTRTNRRVLAAGAVLVTALAAGAFWYVRLRPSPLPPNGDTIGAGGTVRVGENVYVGLRPFLSGEVRETVHVRAVRVRGVPDGMTIVAVHALPAEPGNIIGAFRESHLPRRYDFRPVSEAVLHPGRGEQWTFVVVAHATRPGRFVSRSIDVAWSAGIRHGTTRYDLRVLVEGTAAPGG